MDIYCCVQVFKIFCFSFYFSKNIYFNSIVQVIISLGSEVRIVLKNCEAFKNSSAWLLMMELKTTKTAGINIMGTYFLKIRSLKNKEFFTFWGAGSSFTCHILFCLFFLYFEPDCQFNIFTFSRAAMMSYNYFYFCLIFSIIQVLFHCFFLILDIRRRLRSAG